MANNVPFGEAEAEALIARAATPMAKDEALMCKAEVLTPEPRAVAIDVPFRDWIGYTHDEWW